MNGSRWVWRMMLAACLASCGDAQGTTEQRASAPVDTTSAKSSGPRTSSELRVTSTAEMQTIAPVAASASATASAVALPSISASASAVAMPSASAPRASRFLKENPKCEVPAQFDGWSWKRVHRVEGLDTDAVILTLDVGARLPNLAKVLDVLRDEKVRTTIFLYTGEIGSSPEGPAILKRMLDEGHELANHTLSHKDLTKLDKDEVGRQLDAVETLVHEKTGSTTKPFFREPFLATNDEVDTIIRERCYRPIWFTIDTGDWKDKVTAKDIVTNVFQKRGKPREIERGSIFIFHGSQKENLEALPTVIRGLRERGFSFMTLGEALARSGGR